MSKQSNQRYRKDLEKKNTGSNATNSTENNTDKSTVGGRILNNPSNKAK
ncbi:MAG: hypothetical protein K0S47_497 [Herbinix sp.]|jgi:hypothetical protein|nr:hypothetical protein [Herbinix sp.]